MADHTGPALTAADDELHEASDHWWETETAWFSFNVPERRMGGWLYNQILQTQGVCNGGAWVWDDSPGGTRYEVNHRGLPMPADVDLRDVVLPNGNHMRVVEPLTSYELEYHDPGHLEVELRFDGVIPPHSHPLGVAPFVKGRHFDQPGRVHGTIVLDGERIEVDCFSGRDRSWGPRPMGPDPRKPAVERPADVVPRPPRPKTGVGYSLATGSPTDAFLVYTEPNEDGSDELTAGYVVDGGEYVPLVSGRRRLVFDPQTCWIDRIEIEAVDERGHEFSAFGTTLSCHGASGPSGTVLMRWRWNGVDAVGEDQSYCPDVVWQALGAPGVGR